MSESTTEKGTILEPLTGYILSDVIDFNAIPEERKAQLNELALSE